jgi:hypothetical protein
MPTLPEHLIKDPCLSSCHRHLLQVVGQKIGARGHIFGAEIQKGIAFADSEGFDDEDEALSLAPSKILYSASLLANGDRFDVEAGGW